MVRPVQDHIAEHWPADQGSGMGRALLLTTLHAMRDDGYAYAIIGWPGGPGDRFLRTPSTWTATRARWPYGCRPLRHFRGGRGLSGRRWRGTIPSVTGWLDRWAAREQRRTERENEAQPRGGPITGKGAVSIVLCAALLTVLPWQLWLGLTGIALLAGPGRRWFRRIRTARRAGTAGTQALLDRPID